MDRVPWSDISAESAALASARAKCQETTAHLKFCDQIRSESPADSFWSDSDAFCSAGASPSGCSPRQAWTGAGAGADDAGLFEHMQEMEAAMAPPGYYLSAPCRADAAADAATPGGQPCLVHPAAVLMPQARAAIIDWSVDAAWQLGLPDSALALAVALLDRYLAARGPAAAPLPLAAAACLWVAAKYESARPPPLVLFSSDLLGGVFSRAAFLAAEADVLAAVQYRLAAIATPHAFATLALARLSADGDLTAMTSYLCELALLEYGLVPARPSHVAAAALVLAHALLGRALSPAQLLQAASVAPGELAGPVAWLQRVHEVLALAGRRYAVTVKYLTPSMGCAAHVPPIVSASDARLGACAAAAVAAC